MKKLLSIATASILIAGCFAGCGQSETSESTASSSESKAAVTEEAEEATEEATDEATDEATEADEEETSESEETAEETSESETSFDEGEDFEVTTLPTPEFKPDTVKEEDFVGNWECSKLFTGGQFVEGNFFGVPLNAFVQITVNSDNTGSVGSGIEGSEDAWASFTWEFADNKLTVKMDEDPEDEAEQLSTIIYIQDGEFIMSDEEANELVYFTKVDEFSHVTEAEIMEAMGIDTDSFASTGDGEEESTEETSEVSSDAE